LEAAVCEGDTVTFDVSICNLGDCPLEWAIREMTPTVKILGTPMVSGHEGRPVELMMDPTWVGSVAANEWDPAGPVALLLDDGSAENYLGVGDGVNNLQFIWLNRFTPDPAEFPFELLEISTVFGSTGVNVGDAVDLMVYQDTDGDGDPTNAELLAVYNEVIQAADGATWSSYTLADPLQLSGPGDVLIGVINRYQPGDIGLLDYPAAIDTGVSAYRSWAGWWTTNVAPDPPILPPDDTWGIIDDFGFAGNWLVRGSGETLAPPVDIPWISENPTGGLLVSGQCVTVTVTMDASGMMPGDYLADLIIDSSDPDTPTMTLPAMMTVPEPVAGVDFDWDPDPAIVDEPVAFTAMEPITGTPPFAYAWDFGDGWMGTGITTTHTYTAVGVYTATLWVDNACGIAMAEHPVTVEPGIMHIYLPVVLRNS
jgi:hypothetical protein